MKKLILIGSFVTFFLSCSQEIEKPDILLSKEEITKVIIDMHIMEAKVQMKALPELESNILYGQLLKRIYQKHDIDSLIFFQNYNYYFEQIELLEDIYTSVVDSLSVMNEKKLKAKNK